MTPPLTFRRWLVDTLERSLASLVQALLVFVPTVSGAWDGDVGKALIGATFPAVGAVILAAVSASFPPPASWALDAVLRTVRTFVVTVLSAMIADGVDLFDVTVWRSAALAGLMAAATVVKALIARRVAGTITPASLASENFAVAA